MLKKCIGLCAVIFMVFMLASCDSKPAPIKSNVLSDEVQNSIKQDFAEKFSTEDDQIDPDKVSIDMYYGTYTDGAVALYVHEEGSGYIWMNSEEEIDGFSFSFSSMQPLYIYHNSGFTELKQAYEEGIITKKDLESIHYYYNEKGAPLV